MHGSGWRCTRGRRSQEGQALPARAGAPSQEAPPKAQGAAAKHDTSNTLQALEMPRKTGTPQDADASSTTPTRCRATTTHEARHCARQFHTKWHIGPTVQPALTPHLTREQWPAGHHAVPCSCHLPPHSSQQHLCRCNSLPCCLCSVECLCPGDPHIRSWVSETRDARASP